MTYLLFIASFNAFFFIALLLQKSPKLAHDRVLLYWLLYLGLATGLYGLTIELPPKSQILSSGIIGLFLLHGPFLYLYVSSLTLNKKHINRKKLWHFAPFIGFILYLLIVSRFPTYSEGIRVDHVSDNVAKPPLLFLFFLILTALSGPIYFLLAYEKLKKSKESSLNFSAKDVNIEWLEKLIPIFGIVWTILIVIAVIHHVFHLFTMDFCTNGLFLALSAFVILVGYYGLKQKKVFVAPPVEEVPEANKKPEVKYATTQMEGEELQQCCNMVGQYMIKEKPYLDSDLTLPKLAEGLNVSTHHLSQVINEVHDKNFFNFINKYRVEEVKRKIQDPEFKNYTLLGIAYESGFNSKSAFNRAFRNFTGTTPSKYRDSLPSS